MPCEYLRPPECQFFNTKTGCKAGEKCLSLVKIGPQLGCSRKTRKHWILKRKQSREKFWDQFETYHSSSLRSRSPYATKCQDESNEETGRQKVQNTCKTKLCSSRTQRSGEKRKFAVGTWSVRETPTLSNWSPQGNQRSHDSDDGQRARCKQEKKSPHVTKNCICS